MHHGGDVIGEVPDSVPRLATVMYEICQCNVILTISSSLPLFCQLA